MAGPTLHPTEIHLGGDLYPLRRDHGTAYYSGIYNGNSGSTRTSPILRMRKHYWGGGVAVLRVHKRYYSGHSFGEYVCHGHTRQTHGPYQSISTIYDGGYDPYWDTPVYPSGREEGYCDLKINVSSYEGLEVEIFICGADRVYSSAEGGTSDMYNSMWTSSSFYIY